MLQEPCSLLLNQLVHHVAQHRPNRIEALVCRTDIVQAMIVEKNLLDNEDGDSLAELGSSLHNAQAERNDLGSKEKIDHIRAIVLHQSPDDAQRCKTEILEWARFRGGVEERVQEEWDVC